MAFHNSKWWVILMATAAIACGQSVEPGNSDGGVTVRVRYWTESKSVGLATLTPATVEGNTGARVSEVITAAFPTLVLSLVGADFIAPDGFRPAGKSGCRPLIPVTHPALEKGVLDVQSANLLWAPSLGYGGCMGVKGVAENQWSVPIAHQRTTPCNCPHASALIEFLPRPHRGVSLSVGFPPASQPPDLDRAKPKWAIWGQVRLPACPLWAGRRGRERAR